MKKLIAILLTIVLLTTFLTGCGGKGRELYNYVNLENYVEVSNYLGIEIDTSSQDYIKLYTYYLYSDITNYQLQSDAIKQVVNFDASIETEVQLGDMVNIDYTGYKGETAFEGGTAQGALLSIGSGAFIDNFEDQLIGAKVGQTVDVNVTFPKDYSAAELAGADAKFVVKVNSIAKQPEQIYSLFELKSQDEYTEILNKRAQSSYVFNKVIDGSKVNDYPKKDVDKFYDAAVEYYKSAYGADITNGEKEEVLKDLIYPTMKENMVMYYIFDKENLELYESTVESQQVDNPVIAESYAVNEIVTDYLLDKAKIK